VKTPATALLAGSRRRRRRRRRPPILAPGLRIPRHRATTAQVCAVYPFQAEEGLGPRGVYLGTDVLAGGGAFCYDTFQLYTENVLTSPNVLVIGEVGSGKSSTVKTLLYRSVGVLGSPGGMGRWVAIVDPKGEYRLLAEALGLNVVRLYPGGPTRLNPLDPGPGTAAAAEELGARRAALLGALLSEVLHRDLSPLEDAAVGWAVGEVTGPNQRQAPTLQDIARLLSNPTAEMAAQAKTSPDALAQAVEATRYGLGKLLDRQLRGMFDGQSTVNIDWSGRGLVLDLSAVHQDPEALTLVMMAATAWLQALLAAPEGVAVPRRYQILEECWALLGGERTAKYLQSCWKLSRAYGVVNIAVAHRISDLRAQSDDGTTAAKVAMGLLSDTQTRIIFRQSTDQIGEATSLLGLTKVEAELLPRLARGRALWKVAGHSAVVQGVLGEGERNFCDTDSRLVV
jgi:type IV secretory pathway VirB4 component